MLLGDSERLKHLLQNKKKEKAEKESVSAC
jgi:hypothetical protein